MGSWAGLTVCAPKMPGMDVLLAWVGIVLFVIGLALILRGNLFDLADLRRPPWVAFLLGAVCLGVAWWGLGVQPEDLLS